MKKMRYMTMMVAAIGMVASNAMAQGFLNQIANAVKAHQAPQQVVNQHGGGAGKCDAHYPFGAPVVVSQEKDKIERRSFYLCRDSYAVQFDPASKNPIWVAESVSGAEQTEQKAERTNDFRIDPNVPAPAQASLKDYERSGFDRGHMAPAEDMKIAGGNPDQQYNAMSQSFYLTNMVPQVGMNNNRGIWVELETNVRRWAKQSGEVYVVSGPIYSGNVSVMGRSKVWVPTHLYKVVVNPRTMESIAFIIPNVQVITRKVKKLDDGNPAFPQTLPQSAINCGSGCSLQNFVVSVADVERATQLKFFTRLAANDYARLTNSKSNSWNLR